MPTEKPIPTSSGIPDWAVTSRPHELAFYKQHLETLQETAWAISAMTQILQSVDLDCVCDEDAVPQWWSQRISNGLLMGIQKLIMSAAEPLEFMMDRISEFSPSNPDNSEN